MQYDFTFDAKEKILGRLASQVALALRGKTQADFVPSRTNLPRVVVKNASQLRFNEARLKKKMFWSYSGYPSGRHEQMAWDVAKNNPAELIRRAVWGMLPGNKLREKMIKRLKFER